jgi:hypothetical protein
MTREDIKNIMAFIGMAFPNYKPTLQGEINTVDVLYNLLGDLDLDMLKMAVQACCAEPGRAFAPSAGEIRGMVANLYAQANGVPSAGEAWAAIIDSFRRTSFDQPKLLENPTVKESIRQMGGLNSIGMSENIMAERAHFLKIYSALFDREISTVAQLPVVTNYIGTSIKQLADTLRLEAK